ncbi:MAG: hypothetical protein LBC07_04265 [Elusimicrobiota bacterium]|jgi:hypothetical protein|nr:hypothetical protein [Elusimicrobiota bacterium]
MAKRYRYIEAEKLDELYAREKTLQVENKKLKSILDTLRWQCFDFKAWTTSPILEGENLQAEADAFLDRLQSILRAAVDGENHKIIEEK